MVPDRIVTHVLISRPVEVVWHWWTLPEAVKKWNIPFHDWHCPEAELYLTEGGRFFFRMETIDGSWGVDYAGVYSKIIPFQLIAGTLEDGRKTVVEFQQIDQNTIVRESFDPETFTPADEQQAFCQAILHRFKNYVESQR